MSLLAFGCRSAVWAGPYPLGVLVDAWGAVFIALLGLISSCVLTWSFYYIDSEAAYRRFISVLIRFIVAMGGLILSSTLYLSLVGWDLLGVTSFLLVIYYKNRKALGSGLLTAVTNRVGDAVFLLLLGISLRHVGGLRHWELSCILILAITKSAQYPFSAWLPAAMSAPTPVRALVHSSTLVTAGIYVLIRYNPHENQWLLVAGSVTMLIAGLCACAEMDLKKIVALRTLSQLGVMVVALGLGLKELCFFHLITHALFKALLFVCVGSYIHNVYGGQDFRTFAGISSATGGVTRMLAVACLSLLGFPFMAGFFSKDLILEGAYNGGAAYQSLVWFLMGVGLTTAYRLKLIGLAVPASGQARPLALAGGGWGTRVKRPMRALGVGGVWGGVLIGVDGAPAVLSGLDKVMPLLFVAAGLALSVVVRDLRVRYLSALWNLSPGAQHVSC